RLMAGFRFLLLSVLFSVKVIENWFGGVVKGFGLGGWRGSPPVRKLARSSLRLRYQSSRTEITCGYGIHPEPDPPQKRSGSSAESMCRIGPKFIPSWTMENKRSPGSWAP